MIREYSWLFIKPWRKDWAFIAWLLLTGIASDWGQNLIAGAFVAWLFSLVWLIPRRILFPNKRMNAGASLEFTKAEKNIQEPSRTGKVDMHLTVIDTETTGLTNKDRIVEISVITIELSTGNIIDEFDTLINPLRDIPNSSIHGITAAMVATAPTFEEISTHLANIMQGNIFVAHNISFDQRVLKNEFNKVGIDVEFGKGICTLRKTNQKLEIACKSRGIEISHAHRSLADARATSQLLEHVEIDLNDVKPVSFAKVSGDSNPRTFRRDHVDQSLAMPTIRSRKRVHFPTSDENEVAYLDMLDYLFEDSKLEDTEVAALSEVASELGVSKSNQNFLNKQYLNSFIIAAKRDGIFSDSEKTIVQHLVSALKIENFEIPDFEVPKVSLDSDQIKVCFTGQAVFANSVVPREHLESIASLAGMTSVASVTKKSCTLVVASDVHTMSGKAKKARDFSIPVISVDEFFEREDVKGAAEQVLKKPDWF